MAFIYTTQVAGWSLTVEQFGDPGTVSQLYTITRTTELPQITLTLFYDDGATAYSVTVDPAGTSYSPTPVFAAPAARTVARLLVVEDSGPAVVLDCRWTLATTGENIIGLADCLAYYTPNNIDGRNTEYADGAALTWLRDLSGHERTQVLTGAVTFEQDYWGGDRHAFHFPYLSAGASEAFQQSENWTAYAYTRRALAVDPVIDYVMNAGSQAAYLANGYGSPSTNRVVDSRAYNTAGTEFAATGPTMDTGVEHLYVAVHESGTLAVYVDDMTTPAASTALTGTGRALNTRGLAVNSALGGIGYQGWYGGLALFGVAHDASQRATIGRGVAGLGVAVNLAPAPGGVLTATASPRGRVRVGMSVSPDGGPP